jgi:DNA-binding NarL/FixJ family response regulator
MITHNMETKNMKNKSAETSIKGGKVELQNRFIEMRAKGFSIRKIAKKLHLSP